MSSPPPTAAAARAFVEKWERNRLNEAANAKEHFGDLCRLLGQPTPNEADPDGTFYRYEKPLTKVGGRAGFADVWRRERFAWEYKTKGKYRDLQAAYQQLLLYKDDLDNPPVLAACDIANYEIHISFTGYKTRIERLRNADLATVSGRELLHLILTDPEQLRPSERTATATEQAAAKLAQIALMIERRGFCPEQVAAFFTKLLFAFFAEDIRLLPDHLMSNTLKQCIGDPEAFPERIRALFHIMREGGYFGPLTRVPRFNGGLFEDETALPLTTDEIHLLYEAAKLDWSQMEPAIFGTLFERSLDPSKRSQLGAHYTGTDDIHLIIEPVLMDPLRREWAAVRQEVEVLRPQLEAAMGGARQRLQNRMEGHLFDFMDRLAQVRVLDPACGSGNFLYVALHRLKDLEREVLVYATGVGLTEPELGVTPARFYGIEKNPYAAPLAQVVVWIGYWQWLRNNGLWHVKEPILQTLDTIQCRDAILEVDDAGRPVEPTWPAADVVIGNPPFLGGSKLRRELGDMYAEHLWKLYAGRIPAGADLVAYWFERARESVEAGKTKRAGLLATQAIRTGASRAALERIKTTGDIFMAWSDRPWVLDGAAVRVSMVGFDSGGETSRHLDGQPAVSINADLTSAIDLTSAPKLYENAGIAFVGSQKIGAFDIPELLAEKMLAMPTNSNGRPNNDVVRPSVNGSDVMGRSRHVWIIDFGVGMPECEAALYEAPFEYIRKHVYPERIQNRRATYALKWWQHGEARPGMRTALEGLPRYIVTSRVAKHRVFAWLQPPALPDHKLCVMARADDYFFGVLQSRIHEAWSLAKSGRHGVGNDPAYSASTSFETFPFPYPPGREPEGDPRVTVIATAARELVEKRDRWLNPEGVSAAELKQRTLTNLYNKRPDWLDAAHRQLDLAVLDAYGWPHDLGDEEILARLLALNLERVAAQGGVVATTVQADEEE